MKMVVRCQMCKQDVVEYVFNRKAEPVCLKCSGHKKTMDDLVEVKEKELKNGEGLAFVWNQKDQTDLNSWVSKK